MSEKYQGWTNYDTWNAVLWLGNDERAYGMLMNQLVFTVTQQHKKGAASYAQAVHTAAQSAFGAKTPDGVVITEKKSKVNWGEIAESYQEEIDEFEDKWLEALGSLPTNPAGGLTGVVEAAAKFRADHKYGGQ